MSTSLQHDFEKSLAELHNDACHKNVTINDYLLGKIYGIWHGEHLCYIGSTKRSLEQRKRLHGSHPVNKKWGHMIRVLGGIEKFQMKIVEYFPCISKTVLEAREQEYINSMIPLFNKAFVIPSEERRLTYERKMLNFNEFLQSFLEEEHEQRRIVCLHNSKVCDAKGFLIDVRKNTLRLTEKEMIEIEREKTKQASEKRRALEIELELARLRRSS